MGVDRTDYIMVGLDVGYDRFSWEKHEKELEGAEGRLFDVVRDGMSGKYCYAGIIITSSDCYSGFEPIVLNRNKIDVDKSELADKLSKSFDVEIEQTDLELIVFSHFS